MVPKGKNVFRTIGMLVFIVCFLLLVRKHEINPIAAFFLISCPSILAYLQGVTENIQKNGSTKTTTTWGKRKEG